jgi:hypothetical protein
MKASASRNMEDSIVKSEKRPRKLSLAIACLLTLASAASAQDKSANNMPTKNPWLHDSFNPISHENPAQTDAVDIASGTSLAACLALSGGTSDRTTEEMPTKQSPIGRVYSVSCRTRQ